MIELCTARSGAATLKVDGVALHSPFDPVREAERFVEQTLGGEAPSTVIVLGEGLGHVSRAVALRHPKASLIVAVYSAEIAAATPLSGLAAWNPGSPQPFDEFLRAALGELQVEGLKVIEWPPSARIFPAASAQANESVRRVVQELNGSFVTTVAAGRRWFRNSLCNFVHLGDILSGALCAPGQAVVVTASGPSLEAVLGTLSELRHRVRVWALPSSCLALLDAGISPDLLVLTDPGFYAAHHVQFIRLDCPVAMPLSAARGIWALRPPPPVWFLAQPFLVERAFLDAAGYPYHPVAAQGTVAATAVQLALSCTNGPVVVAGLDLAARDLAAHVRPNAFDRLLHLDSSRLRPHYSQAFERAGLFGLQRPASGNARVSPALRTYAGWFQTGLGPHSKRLFRVLPSPVALTGMRPLDLPGLRSLLSTAPASQIGSLAPVPHPRSFEDRKRIASRVLGSWRTEVEAALRQPKELDPFPAVRELLYLLSPRRLMDARRKERLGEASAAGETVRDALEECRGVLREAGDSLGA